MALWTQIASVFLGAKLSIALVPHRPNVVARGSWISRAGCSTYVARCLGWWSHLRKRYVYVTQRKQYHLFVIFPPDKFKMDATHVLSPRYQAYSTLWCPHDITFPRSVSMAVFSNTSEYIDIIIQPVFYPGSLPTPLWLRAHLCTCNRLCTICKAAATIYQGNIDHKIKGETTHFDES